MTVESPAQRAVSRQLMERLAGSAIATTLVRDLRNGRAAPDAFAAIVATLNPERLRGFAQAIERTILLGHP